MEFPSFFYYLGLGCVYVPKVIVYNIRWNIWADSPPDFTDILLSRKHMPNIEVELSQ